MIRDRPNRLARWFAIHVAERWIISRFSKVRFIGNVQAQPDQASLVLMNHFSFNDGGFLHRICRTILRKQFKVMVVEQQLRAFGRLKYIGCFSVNKGSRDMIESLNYAADMLKNPDNMLGIYPQGEVYSMHLNRVHFETGLSYILKRTISVKYQVFFGVILVDFLDSFKPNANVYLMEYMGDRSVKQMEAEYNAFYGECKRKQQALHRPPDTVIDP